MHRCMNVHVMRCASAAALILAASVGEAQPVRVRHLEGLVHGFLVLRASDGKVIARGDLEQTADGRTVTSRLTFHFADGSLYDETASFSQRSSFRLIRDHVVERGQSFPRALDMRIDAAAQRVRVAYSDDGKEKTVVRRVQVPPDLANGLIPVILKNVDRKAPPKELSMIVATPEPRLIRLDVAGVDPESWGKGDERQRVTKYTLKPRIGGIKGLLAPLVGRQPPDAHVWILQGTAPAFLAAEQQFYPDGPIWRIELSVPPVQALQR